MRIAGIVMLIVGALVATVMWLLPAQTALVGHQWRCPGVPIDVLFTEQVPTESTYAAQDYASGCTAAKVRRMTIGSIILIPIVAAGCALLVASRERTRRRD